MSTIQPSPLFKYRDDSARTEQIITTGKVWLATASQLNDPLECKTGQIPESWKRKKIREMENAQLSGFALMAARAVSGRGPFFSLSPRAAKRWAKQLKRLRTHKERYNVVRSFLEDHGHALSRPAELFEGFERQLARVGVFSLSECPDNQLMWAHYAAGHTGLAIGFDRLPKSKLASADQTTQVTYADSKPVFNEGFLNQVSISASVNDGALNTSSTQKISFNDPTFRAAFSTKPLIWSYEREWRYVEESSGLFAWPGPIAKVIVGLRMPEVRKKYYASLVSSAIQTPVAFCEIMLAADAHLEVIPWSDRH